MFKELFWSMFGWMFGLGLMPMQAVRMQIGALLAADATTLAPGAAANKIMLIKAPFNLNEQLTLGALTAADFTGSAPKSGAIGAQQVAVDPILGEQVITINVPAGGWRWVTADAVHLPQTIYGYALIDDAGAVLIGAATLDTPVQLTASGQQVDIGEVVMKIVPQPVS